MLDMQNFLNSGHPSVLDIEIFADDQVRPRCSP